MNNATDLLTVTVFILSTAKSLDFIYLFQIKEYRLDRFSSFIKENNLLEIFYLKRPRIPAKTARNITGLIIATIITGYFLLTIRNQLSLLIIAFLATPLISFVIVGAAITITSVPSIVKKLWLINKAKTLIEKSNAIFIGITGSYGKTLVKEFLYSILSSKYPAAKTEANMNTDIGVALSVIKNLKNDTRFFIAEMGAYKKGEIKTICDYLQPRYAILTGIGNQHLDLFGSKTNLVKAKKELLEAIPKDGKIYVNRDIPVYADVMKDLGTPFCSYSLSDSKAGIYAGNSNRTSGNDNNAEVIYQNKNFDISFNLIGEHNLINLLPCIALALDLGISTGEIKTAVAGLKPVIGKLSMHKGINGCTILNDSANSNVEGFIAAIKTAGILNYTNKIIVSKGIIELGREKNSSYQRIINEIERNNITLYTTDKSFTVTKKADINYFLDEKSLLNQLISVINDKTLVVIEGRFNTRTIEQLMSKATTYKNKGNCERETLNIKH